MWVVDGESHPSSRRIHEERMNIFSGECEWVKPVSDPGPHNLVHRPIRRANTGSTVPPTLVDVTSTECRSKLGTQSLRGCLQSLDMIDLVEVWKVRGNIMKNVPKHTKPGCAKFWDAVSLREERGDDLLQIRG